jgi:hypothetical protein
MNEFTKIMPLTVAHLIPKSYEVIDFRLESSLENLLMEEKLTNSWSSLFYFKISLTESTIISITLEMC